MGTIQFYVSSVPDTPYDDAIIAGWCWNFQKLW